MAQREATLYRMKLPNNECPFGLLAKRMLEDADFSVDEHLLTSREQVEEFKAEHGISTTPLVFIDGQKIGGSDELARHLEQVSQE